MILIREDQEATLDALDLQDVKRSQAFGDWEAVIQLVVDDQVGGCPVVQVPRGIPLLVLCSVLRQRPVEVMVGEEQLLARILVQRAEDAVVRHQRFEFPPKGVPLDPVDHVPAVRGAERHGVRGIDVRQVSFDVFEAFDDVLVGSAAP